MGLSISNSRGDAGPQFPGEGWGWGLVYQTVGEMQVPGFQVRGGARVGGGA